MLLNHFVVALINVCPVKLGDNVAAAFIDIFLIGTGDKVPCRGKIAPYLREKCFLFCLAIALQSYALLNS